MVVRAGSVFAAGQLLAASLVFAVSAVCLGCLFTGSTNSRPKAQIALLDELPLHAGDSVTLSASSSSDADGDQLSFGWQVVTCDGCVDRTSGNGETFGFRLLRRARVDVTLRVRDSRGAVAETSTSLQTENRRPVAVPEVRSPRNARNNFPPFTDLILAGENSYDPDLGDAIVSYRWEVVTRPLGSTAMQQRTVGDSGFIITPDADGTFVVRLTVSDGELESSEPPLLLQVDPDWPPCIDLVSPAAGGRLVFDRESARRLQVMHVADDLDAYPGGSSRLHFRWLTQRDGGSPLGELRSHDLPFLDLDPQEFGLGDVGRVRVMVEDRVDRQAQLASCGEQQPTCSLVAGCAQWVTWEVEFR